MKSILLVAMPLIACAPQTPPKIQAPGKCSITGLKAFIGKRSTVGLANDALKRANANTVRVIGPGEAVTMDYRADRLNIHIDDKGNIDHFNCG